MRGPIPIIPGLSAIPWRRPAFWATVMALLQAVLLVRTAWDKSDVADEPQYLAAAALQWVHWDFDFNNEAPALPKWGYGLALRLAAQDLGRTPARRDWAQTSVLWSRPGAEVRWRLFAARLATVTVTVGAGLLVFAAASRFGPAAGLAAHALWALSPTVLANGSLATLDAWAAAAMALLLWTAVCFVERPDLWRAAATGVAVALGAATKVTTLGASPLLLALQAVALRRAGREWRAVPAAWGATIAASFLALWAVYAFDVGPVSTVDLAETYGARDRLVEPVPFPAWWQGLLRQTALGAKGHLAYLDGEAKMDGWWWFYLAAAAYKTTVGAQLLLLLALAALVRRRPGLVDVALLAFPALLFTVMSLGRTQMGVRYLLPIFPFVIVWAGLAARRVQEAFGRRGTVLVAAALALGAAESLRVHPHHLMFFNLWAGGPEGGPKRLVVGDDWGQDQRRLGEWIREKGLGGLYYTHYAGNPRTWGIEGTPPPCHPRPGVYALHAVEVHRPRRIDEGCLDWLTVDPPDERIGWSIYVYYVNRERIAGLLARRGQGPFWRR